MVFSMDKGEDGGRGTEGDGMQYPPGPDGDMNAPLLVRLP